ncbi:L-ribulose-5-phosphate 4-epimerase [Trueperella sp. LYQ143]|uniref:L-ribulose-5-phosphate 4-epimerase n=1 Tax=unclassified Trueperella TaxID=2630174 RepID=UPI0039836D09
MQVLREMPEEIQKAVAACRQRVSDLHGELVKYNLVVWTAGNVSERVPGADLFVIKPSGVRYEELSADKMVVCTLDGEKIDDGTPASLVPSSDTAAHAYVYRNMPEVGGVVHTHSTYATAWAAIGKPVPAILTMMGDEFGGDIPIGPFALIGDDSIGRGIVETLRNSNSPAVLMQNHGPFTIGKNAEAAVKAAAMCEEVARTVAIAYQLGDPIPIPPEKIASLYDRYQNVYGQHDSEEK